MQKQYSKRTRKRTGADQGASPRRRLPSPPPCTCETHARAQTHPDQDTVCRGKKKGTNKTVHTRLVHLVQHRKPTSPFVAWDVGAGWKEEKERWRRKGRGCGSHHSTSPVTSFGQFHLASAAATVTRACTLTRAYRRVACYSSTSHTKKKKGVGHSALHTLPGTHTHTQKKNNHKLIARRSRSALREYRYRRPLVHSWRELHCSAKRS